MTKEQIRKEIEEAKAEYFSSSNVKRNSKGYFQKKVTVQPSQPDRPVHQRHRNKKGLKSNATENSVINLI